MQLRPLSHTKAITGHEHRLMEYNTEYPIQSNTILNEVTDCRCLQSQLPTRLQPCMRYRVTIAQSSAVLRDRCQSVSIRHRPRPHDIVNLFST